jgi:hypothetical protein
VTDLLANDNRLAEELLLAAKTAVADTETERLLLLRFSRGLSEAVGDVITSLLLKKTTFESPSLLQSWHDPCVAPSKARENLQKWLSKGKNHKSDAAGALRGLAFKLSDTLKCAEKADLQALQAHARYHALFRSTDISPILRQPSFVDELMYGAPPLPACLLHLGMLIRRSLSLLEPLICNNLMSSSTFACPHLLLWLQRGGVGSHVCCHLSSHQFHRARRCWVDPSPRCHH